MGRPGMAPSGAYLYICHRCSQSTPLSIHFYFDIKELKGDLRDLLLINLATHLMHLKAKASHAFNALLLSNGKPVSASQ